VEDVKDRRETVLSQIRRMGVEQWMNATAGVFLTVSFHSKESSNPIPGPTQYFHSSEGVTRNAPQATYPAVQLPELEAYCSGVVDQTGREKLRTSCQ